VRFLCSTDEACAELQSTFCVARCQRFVMCDRAAHAEQLPRRFSLARVERAKRGIVRHEPEHESRISESPSR